MRARQGQGAVPVTRRIEKEARGNEIGEGERQDARR
jgi:hypothetical protein